MILIPQFAALSATLNSLEGLNLKRITSSFIIRLYFPKLPKRPSFVYSESIPSNEISNPEHMTEDSASLLRKLSQIPINV